MEKSTINYTDNEYENFRMYHQLQYDRIAQLEERRENFSNIVISVSLAVIAFGFPKEVENSLFVVVGLSLIVIFINICAYVFANKTHYFVKMHQDRASLAREKYSPEFNLINLKVGKKGSYNATKSEEYEKKEESSINKENFKIEESLIDKFTTRPFLYKFLHCLIILVTFVILLSKL